MSSASAPEPAGPRAGRWAWLAATFFGAGRLKPGPGTWGSLAAVGLWSLFAFYTPAAWHALAAIAGAALALAVGIPAATRVAQECGKKDPQFVVVDEVCGQLIALIGASLRWQSVLASFILFRAFDIVKPPPLRGLEKIPEGAGIMLDDVGAGLYALLIMRLLAYYGILN